jgi:hypothetical protein
MNGTVDRGGGRPVAARRWIGLLAGSLGLASGAWAQPAKLTLKDMTAQSDLVFRGQVEAMEYVMSEAGGPEGTSVPYTFVTYRVDEVLRGDNPGEVITLRFIGGLDVQTGRFLQTSISPRIDVGDQDILFVRGNTTRMVPLVGSTEGRLRIIDGQVYNEMGRSVKLNDQGGITLGDKYNLEDVETQVIGEEIKRLRFEEGRKELPSDAAGANAVADLVRALSDQAGPADGEFVSADPSAPVAAPDMTPAPPPAPKPGENIPAPSDLPAEQSPRKG